MRILLNGCLGRMGRAVAEQATAGGDTIVAGIDLNQGETAFPLFTDFAACNVEADVVIDFSNPAALAAELDYVTAKGVPLVLCTTGLSEEQLAAVKDAAAKVPVFHSSNMSLGVGLLSALTKKAAAVLGATFDIEIVEMHHNQKLDAPSGTALMLADAAREGLDYEPAYTYTRHDRRQKREKNEIGIAALRGGNIVGEHQVHFCGQDETIVLTHRAQSRGLFAGGALAAARYIEGKAAGLYNMNHLMDEI